MSFIVKRDELIRKRKAMNLSQHKLSIICGLTGNSIYRMENEYHRVSNLRAMAVAKSLNCDIKELFTL